MWRIQNFFFFFFQAEDGIRDADVTGVQTCALPISERRREQPRGAFDLGEPHTRRVGRHDLPWALVSKTVSFRMAAQRLSMAEWAAFDSAHPGDPRWPRSCSS